MHITANIFFIRKIFFQERIFCPKYLLYSIEVLLDIYQECFSLALSYVDLDLHWTWTWTCTELCEAFTYLMENIYMQLDGMVYQQIVAIPMGTNCAPLIADLFLYCYERNFMSKLQKCKRFDLRQIQRYLSIS